MGKYLTSSSSGWVGHGRKVGVETRNEMKMHFLAPRLGVLPIATATVCHDPFPFLIKRGTGSFPIIEGYGVILKQPPTT